MPSDSHEQQLPPSVSDKKTNGESQNSLNSDEIRAGTKIPMTHAQRQAFLKTSRLGQVFGVAHLLPEVAKLTDADTGGVITPLVYCSINPQTPRAPVE